MGLLQTKDDLNLRHWAARLLVVCLLLRALIPLGFMPDFSAAANGTFKVVICSATGAKTVTLGPDGNPVHNPAKSNAHDACPFGAAPLAAAPPSFGAVAQPVEFASAQTVRPYNDVIEVWRAGPALGSRAPPA